MKQTSAQSLFKEVSNEIVSKKIEGAPLGWCLLVNALESIGYLEAALEHPERSHGNALLAIFSYQSLANCTSALPRSFTAQFPRLAESVFFDVSGDRAKPWFDRMVSAHQTDFYHFLLETLSLLQQPDVRQGILHDIRALRGVIEKTFVGKFSIAVIKQLPELRTVKLPADTVRFTLSASHKACVDPFANIRAIFRFTEERYRAPTEFRQATIQSRVAALMLAQFVGNNVNLLASSGITLSCAGSVIENRNKIAHAKSLSELIDISSPNIWVQMSIWYQYLRVCFITLKDEVYQRFPMVPAEEPGLGLEPKASFSADSKESKEAKAAEPEVLALVTVDRFQNQLQLLEKLVKTGIILEFNLDVFKTRQTPLSDYNIVELLYECICSDNIKSFNEILDNLHLYTKTPAKKLVNIPLVLKQDYKRSAAVQHVIPPLSTYDMFPMAYKIYKIQDGLEHSEDHYFAYELGFKIRSNREGPMFIDHYLIASAIVSEKNSANLTKRLLRCGANPNVETLYNEGTFEPLITSAILKGKETEVRMMVAHGACLNLLDGYGSPIIHAIAQQGSTEMLKFVLEHNIDTTREYPVLSNMFLMAVGPLSRGGVGQELQHDARFKCNSFLGFIIDKYIKDSEAYDACKLLVNSEVRTKGFDLGIKIITGTAKPITDIKGTKPITALQAAQACAMNTTEALVVYLNALLLHADDKRFELFKVCVSNSRDMIEDFLATQSTAELIPQFSAKLPLQLKEFSKIGLCYLAVIREFKEFYDLASRRMNKAASKEVAVEYWASLRANSRELDHAYSCLSSSLSFAELSLIDFVALVVNDDQVIQYLENYKYQLLSNHLEETFVACRVKFERAPVSSKVYTPLKSITPAALVAAYLGDQDVQATFASKVSSRKPEDSAKPKADVTAAAPSAVARLERKREHKGPNPRDKC